MSIRVTVEPMALRLSPRGQPARLRVTVFNGTSLVDEFWVGAAGSEAWLEAPPQTLRLFPDSEGSLELTLGISPGVLPPAGQTLVAIHTRSASDPSVANVQVVQVTVDAVVAEHGILLEPQVLSGGNSAQARVTVQNRGNAALPVMLRAVDPEGILKFRFDPPSIVVPPAASQISWLTVSADRPLRGQEKTRQFTVQAEGAERILTASGSFHQRPVATAGRMWLLRVVLTALGALLIAVAALVPLDLTATPNGGWRKHGEEQSALSWTYFGIAQENLDEDYWPARGRLRTILDLPVISVGAVMGLFAVLILVGAFTRRGRLARVFAILTPVGLVVFFVALSVRTKSGSLVPPQSAAYLALIGSAVAFAGGLLVRR